MKKIIFIGVIALCCFQIRAQVGINIVLPDSSAALHIDGNGKKGLLIPVMKGHRETMRLTHSAADGLLVYDDGQKIFYFYNKASEKWIALNPLQATDSNTGTLELADGGSTITFDNDIVAAKTLTVTGNTTLQSPVVVNNTLTANGSIISNGSINAGTYSIDAGTVNATTVNVGAGTVITTDKVKTTSFEGYGVTPIGGIIMWSGANIPDGWMLCDGSLVVPGWRTPDLRGRFVVGYNPNDTDYSSPGNLSEQQTPATPGKTGGQKEVKLEINQLAIHSHGHGATKGGKFVLASGASSVGYSNGNRGLDETSREYVDKTATEGNGEPHENRPPYYVLAFIMRVK